jgi:hypothetical protein
MAYKYLSEPIVLYFTLPENLKGTNVSYTVTDEATGVPLYNGSVYATGGQQKLVLNDIAALIQDNYNWFRNPDAIGVQMTHVIEDSPSFATLVVTFDNGYNYEVSNILFAYDYPTSTGGEFIPQAGDNELVSMNEWGTGVLPRIPLITKTTSKLFAMFSFLYSSTSYSNANRINLSAYDGLGHIYSLSNVELSEDPTITKILYGPPTLNVMYTYTDRGLKGLSAALLKDSQMVSPYKTIAFIDENPADYYICWINRYGTWQCQPMCAKWEMTEKVTTDEITTVYDEIIPYAKTSEYSWTLNSHWLNYAEHEEFESLLHSKYVYLFSPKYNEGYFVNVKDSNWTFKTEVNAKKPFNLTLNVTKSTKQSITI